MPLCQSSMLGPSTKPRRAGLEPELVNRLTGVLLANRSGGVRFRSAIEFLYLFVGIATRRPYLCVIGLPSIAWQDARVLVECDIAK